MLKSTIWDDPKTLIAQELAYKGLTQKTIERFVGLTVDQVGYRLRKLGVSTQEW